MPKTHSLGVNHVTPDPILSPASVSQRNFTERSGFWGDLGPSGREGVLSRGYHPSRQGRSMTFVGLFLHKKTTKKKIQNIFHNGTGVKKNISQAGFDL